MLSLSITSRWLVDALIGRSRRLKPLSSTAPRRPSYSWRIADRCAISTAVPGLIRLRYSGDTGLTLQPDGSLTAKTPLGEVTEAAPYSFAERVAVGS